jgi:NADPH2:quinone reductase
MKTVIVKDKKPIIADAPYPLLKSGEIIIKVDYAGMNRADLMQRDGIYPSPIGWPDIMGLEVSGEVYELSEEAKKNSSFHIGDKVCALLGGGGYSEFVSVPYELVLSLPKGIDTRIGAAIPEVYCTAYLNLFVEGKLQKGETVYVTAGASGVGIAVTQLAKAYGAKVITSVRSEEKKQAIKKFGADIIINLKNESLFDVFEQNPVDLVIDSVGGNDAGKLFSMLNRGGRWICIATMGGDTSEFDMRIAYKKALRLIGSTLRARTNEVKHDILSHLSDEFFHLFADGTITPEIYKVFDIEQVEEAREEMRNNKKIGKILLHVSHKN